MDQKHQNKGYGTIFLGELMPFLESEFGAQLLTTTYIEGNHHAQYLYEKTGFVEMDRVQVDTVWEVNLKKSDHCLRGNHHLHENVCLYYN
ncbi:GNAT family N-acetyltransferase [Enterococcus alcedinis]|uniref:GNAT family N-acetyltransferase n=1 Tax=Enterococcus alcedinis TaxID=1274384 RepID=UPI003610BEC4